MAIVGLGVVTRRGVWIELLPGGAPPVPAWRRDLGRPARARWISGRRLGSECWDAYEAIEGRPLLEAIGSPQPWSRVRHWIADLAQEIAAGLKDGSLPALAFDRVWIGSDDRARLLDWAPARASASSIAPAPTLEFLRTLQAAPTQLDIAVFPNADHGIIENDRQSAGYHDLLAAWIRTRKLEGSFGTAILQPDVGGSQ